jgi:asparagine synthase (glutamine-hydrolysing)
VFRGHADTEVLPHLYEEEGAAGVAKLRGMFALAIYDTRARTLLLARDRFGIKPLFYAPARNRLAFASELGALLGVPDLEDSPNRQAIYDFAALFYIPAPETFYTGVRALQPGELLEARLHGHEVSWQTRLFHRWLTAPNPTLTLVEAVERAHALVTTAVRRQLESDVPLGALLSGGIDSSLVSAAAQEALGGGLQTFNVRFWKKEYDETWAAVAVAKHIGSSHKTLDMDDLRGSWEHVVGLLQHAGQPFADTSLFAVHAVCRLMRQHVTVALSGDGGDEGFGGYNLYRWLRTISHWQRLPLRLWHSSATLMGGLAQCGLPTTRLAERIGNLSGADDTAILQTLLCWVRDDEHRRLCLDTDCLPVRRWFEPQWEYHLPPGTSRLERLSAYATEVDTRLRLPNDFLFKVDTASMKESLEVRVPMLDEELFAFGISLPHSLKVQGRTGKRVLRAVARRQLPLEVVHKPKHGFTLPLDIWVNGDFKVCLRETLLGPSSKLPEFFRPEAYQHMVEAFCKDQPCRGISREGLYQRVIMLLSVQLALARTT